MHTHTGKYVFIKAYKLSKTINICCYFLFVTVQQGDYSICNIACGRRQIEFVCSFVKIFCFGHTIGMEYNEDEGEQSSEEDWLDTKWSTADSSALSCSEPKYRAGEQKSVAACDTESTASHGRDGSNQLMSRMQLNDNKAGMEGLDKTVINQIIYEASKGSKFFENEKKKEEQVQQRIQEQETCRQKITEAELKRGLDEADKLISQLKENLDLSQTIVHVDMDAFYAAVEMRDDPSLRHKPMAVGGIGMLSTSNYEARKFGVRAAMPGFIGRKLCPQLEIVPPNFSKYTAVSQQIREVFAEYDPGYCPISLDEAYLNFTDHMEKRPLYSPVQRTYLHRCQSPPNISLCCCDLNCTIRLSLLESKSLETEHVQVLKNAADVSETTCRVEKNYFRMESCLNAKSSSKNSHVVSSSLDPHSSAQDTAVQDKSADSLDASQSVNTAHCILLSNTSFSNLNEKKHQEMMPACKEKGEENQDSKLEKDLKNKPPGTGMICPSCCKKIPAYEVITFGTDVESAVQEMRCRIEQRTLLTASAGIASNMMLAKVCSDQNKPNGQFFLPPDYNTIMEFVSKLPIRKISGIGRVSEQLLQALGITHCSDLYCQRALLYHLYSSVSFNYFMRIACGIGSVQVARDEDRKSMSTEQTFRELSHPKELYSKCLELCQNLASDLASEGLLGKTVSLKLKTVDFQVRTRAHTLSSYTNDSETIFSVAKSILHTEIQAELPKILRLRLMGVRMAKLIPESECPRDKQETIMGFLNKRPSEKINDKTRPNYMRDALFVKNPENHFTVESSSRHKQISEDCDHNATSNEHQEKACTDEFPGGKRATALGMTILEKVRGVTETKSLEEKASESFARDNLDKDSGCQVDTTEVTKVQSVNACSTQISKTEDIRCGKTPGNDSTILEKCSDHTLQSQVEGSPVCVGLRKKMHSSCSAEGNYSLVDDVGVCLNETTILKASCTAQTRDCQISTQCLGTVEGHEPSAMSLLAKSPTSVQHTQDTHVLPSQFVREPMLLCPVCFKHVNCVNLVDFNAHIDKCLLGTSPNSSQSSDCSQKQNKPKVLSSQKSRKQATEKRPSRAQKRLTELHTRSEPEAMFEESRACRSHNGLSEGNGGFDSSNTTSAADCVHFGESSCSKESVEYMVCPLCGAERADWTLGSFNQHVDACLNRETISQILQEQKHSDEQHRKRPGNSQDNEFFSQGAVKRAKKTPSQKNGKSILSFFRS